MPCMEKSVLERFMDKRTPFDLGNELKNFSSNQFSCQTLFRIFQKPKLNKPKYREYF